jgi:hypothetical protein
MLFQHAYLHAGPGQKKSQHHAGRSSSGNAATSVDGVGHLEECHKHGRDPEKGRQLGESAIKEARIRGKIGVYALQHSKELQSLQI